MSGSAAQLFCDGPVDVGVGVAARRAEPLWQPWAVSWYILLSVIATSNICTYAMLKCCYRFSADPEMQAYQKFMLRTAMPFVLVGAYRSYLPSQYPNRYVWFDTPLSSLLLVRSLAAIAEMSFISQVAKGLSVIGHQVYLAAGGCLSHCLLQLVARAMVAIIFIAQCFSFAGLVSESNLWFAWEEFCWGLAFLLGLPFFCLLSCRVWRLRSERCLCCRSCCNAFIYAVGLSIFSLVYVPYIFLFDVPVYYRRYQSQLREGFQPLGLWEGTQDAAATRRLTHALDVWRYPRVWQTAYFSAGVWMSMLLALAPRFEIAEAAADRAAVDSDEAKVVVVDSPVDKVSL
mmetsp:Transcript_87949/g.257113  ORF Transcript_87949/g.257113 Transcript_87949/m.257113 type:complete len:344 (+) Transcript_87949:81-1112(+)